jgi:hypothetical protein
MAAKIPHKNPWMVGGIEKISAGSGENTRKIKRIRERYNLLVRLADHSPHEE